MARLARVEVFSPDEVAVVHVINRTVRRCFLMGNDPLTGKNYDHRKSWMENELRHLAAHFGIDLLCYAILSNHFHLVIRSRPDVVALWDDTEVARRWLMLCPKRKRPDKQPAEPNEAELNAIRNDPQRVQQIRWRLSDISWWMRLLCQKIGMRANREDREVGKFWQARYRAVRLLDETALLACAAYVDLNPIRAAMAETIEGSHFTSAQQRALQLREALAASAAEGGIVEGSVEGSTSAGSSSDDSSNRSPFASTDRTIRAERPANPSVPKIKPIARSLCPVGLEESGSGIGPCRHEGGDRASDKGFLPLSTAQYLELLDWTARQARDDKRGATPACAAPLFERLGIDAQSWCELTKDFGRLFSTVAGKPKVIDATRSRRRGRRYNIPSRTRRLLTI